MQLPSMDQTPWQHPYLIDDNISRFRSYSEQLWEFAEAYQATCPRTLDIGFSNNLAQTMYMWATLANGLGAKVRLYLNPQDRSAISRPEWEEFDGEFSDVHAGPEFLNVAGYVAPRVPVIEAPNDGSELWNAYYQGIAYSDKEEAERLELETKSPSEAEEVYPRSRVFPDYAAIERLRLQGPTINHDVLLNFSGHYPYFEWSKLLATHDVNYIASTPFPALASGKPYCVCPVGGDLQTDSGRNDALGESMRQSMENASFIFVTNPHVLGHLRRLGLSNGIYVPYPMDLDRYSPGEGNTRQAWLQEFGGELIVLVTSRIDHLVKGFGRELLMQLKEVVSNVPRVRFVFLGWGQDVEAFKSALRDLDLETHVRVVSPVGKARLRDYYRSCDIVLDQLTYGYYGATLLEAAACGKPVVMKLRTEHYAGLYKDDVAPVNVIGDTGDVGQTLTRLLEHPGQRLEQGKKMRQWMLRNHGESAARRMLALLRFAADKPANLYQAHNPLLAPLTDEERAYHLACHTAAKAQNP